MLKKLLLIITVLFVGLLLIGCTVPDYETVETSYTVVEKETRQEYNWLKSEFWGKAYYDNEYYLILEDVDGEVSSEKVTQTEYYEYDIGDTYVITTSVPIMEDD